ncbi:glucosyl transferase [Moraxella caviae]|uniref:Glucosyl transferase n=1 Tax=Moraxella caviae TaxID=34060 RepID=A0A1S9ZWR9_9GAMM|nr:glycosyltransferase family 4 protein [Moraxella caviae]OOR87898.1 glucosyl transferase [Moraxella caviae]STZ14603.1 N-acetyl-alpha-D-glucosaminyl L-malate synthase BshA [Moraxella caviae]VEW11372.1 N-acetyl-alpha-D-glucosaminyl L-malate synthase BshA [Moraxella caviae]
MKILHVLLTRLAIPPKDYGGTERVIWALAVAQRQMGHEVRFLTKANPNNNPDVQLYDKSKSIAEQIDDWPDVVHFHWPYDGELHKPYICTEHSNAEKAQEYPINTVFLSSKHAENHGATCYVHNGLYWADYSEPNLDNPKDYVHFLAKAAWRVKNLQGTIDIAKQAGKRLEVIGGKRFNLSRNPYFYLSPNIGFNGMVGGVAKDNLIKNSKGLIFPVLWHEPFGLAIIESMYLGCPVFASPFGSLPDIISHDGLGVLSDSYSELAEAVKQVDKYDRRVCHEHAKTHFGHEAMGRAYQKCYERVIAGETLNPTRPKSTGNVKALLEMKP